MSKDLAMLLMIKTHHYRIVGIVVAGPEFKWKPSLRVESASDTKIGGR
jgi:hypothetical protein